MRWFITYNTVEYIMLYCESSLKLILKIGQTPCIGENCFNSMDVEVHCGWGTRFRNSLLLDYQIFLQKLVYSTRKCVVDEAEGQRHEQNLKPFKWVQYFSPCDHQCSLVPHPLYKSLENMGFLFYIVIGHHAILSICFSRDINLKHLLENINSVGANISNRVESSCRNMLNLCFLVPSYGYLICK